MTQQVRSIHLNLRGIAPGQILSDAIGRLATWSLPSLYNKVVINLFEKDYDDRVHSQPSLIAEYSDTLRGETCLGYALWKEQDREYEFRSGSPRDRSLIYWQCAPCPLRTFTIRSIPGFQEKKRRPA